MKLVDCTVDKTYNIATINTFDTGMKDFLFSLGCYPGENITLISQLSSNYVINVKDARYSIDRNLASAIEVQEMDNQNSLKESVV